MRRNRYYSDVYNKSSRQYQNQQISLCKFVTKLEVEKKLHNPYVSFDMVTFAIYSNNNGIWFSFQNVTPPPHAVNVPFISLHIKVSISSLQPDLST